MGWMGNLEQGEQCWMIFEMNHRGHRDFMVRYRAGNNFLTGMKGMKGIIRSGVAAEGIDYEHEHDFLEERFY